jgi:rRNA maturation endonuclease Nob1
MARFRCHACGSEGTFAYFGKHECPNCGSANVQFALSIEEMADDDPLIVALTNMAESDTEQP